jgi:hypothetical protein
LFDPLLVKITLWPVQKVSGVELVILGVSGIELTVTVTVELNWLLHSPSIDLTEYAPADVTVSVFEFEFEISLPFRYHRLFVSLLVNTTFWPAQKVREPEFEILGTGTAASFVIETVSELVTQSRLSVFITNILLVLVIYLDNTLEESIFELHLI